MSSGTPSSESSARWVHIEPAELVHAQQIAQMYVSLIDPPWSEESVLTALANETSLAFVAVNNGFEVIGFAIAQVVVDEAELFAIGVSPSLQRRGVARLLLAAVEQVARQRGAHCLHLEVARDNVPACRFYEAAGFQEAGSRAGYYRRKEGSAVDANLLMKAI